MAVNLNIASLSKEVRNTFTENLRRNQIVRHSAWLFVGIEHLQYYFSSQLNTLYSISIESSSLVLQRFEKVLKQMQRIQQIILGFFFVTKRTQLDAELA